MKVNTDIAAQEQPEVQIEDSGSAPKSVAEECAAPNNATTLALIAETGKPSDDQGTDYAMTLITLSHVSRQIILDDYIGKMADRTPLEVCLTGVRMVLSR